MIRSEISYCQLATFELPVATAALDVRIKFKLRQQMRVFINIKIIWYLLIITSIIIFIIMRLDFVHNSNDNRTANSLKVFIEDYKNIIQIYLLFILLSMKT